MPTQKLNRNLRKKIAADVEAGLTTKDACLRNGVSNQTFYYWSSVASKAEKKDIKERTDYEKECLLFQKVIAKAKVDRQLRRVKALEALKTGRSYEFLLKNEAPETYNKRPVLVPNFQVLFEFTRTEYSQHYHNRIWEIVSEAEADRQSRVEYDESSFFSEDDDSEDGTSEDDNSENEE